MKALIALALLLTTTFGGNPLTADGTLTASIGEGVCVVELGAANLPTTSVGGQFFIEFNTSVMSFSSAEAGDAPFTRIIYSNVNGNHVDFASGIESGGSGTSADRVYGRITFTMCKAGCAETWLVRWREGPNGAVNMLSSDQAEAITLTTNSNADCE